MTTARATSPNDIKTIEKQIINLTTQLAKIPASQRATHNESILSLINKVFLTSAPKFIEYIRGTAILVQQYFTDHNTIYLPFVEKLANATTSTLIKPEDRVQLKEIEKTFFVMQFAFLEVFDLEDAKESPIEEITNIGKFFEKINEMRENDKDKNGGIRFFNYYRQHYYLFKNNHQFVHAYFSAFIFWFKRAIKDSQYATRLIKGSEDLFKCITQILMILMHLEKPQDCFAYSKSIMPHLGHLIWSSELRDNMTIIRLYLKLIQYWQSHIANKKQMLPPDNKIAHYQHFLEAVFCETVLIKLLHHPVLIAAIKNDPRKIVSSQKTIKKLKKQFEDHVRNNQYKLAFQVVAIPASILENNHEFVRLYRRANLLFIENEELPLLLENENVDLPVCKFITETICDQVYDIFHCHRSNQDKITAIIEIGNLLIKKFSRHQEILKFFLERMPNFTEENTEEFKLMIRVSMLVYQFAHQKPVVKQEVKQEEKEAHA